MVGGKTKFILVVLALVLNVLALLYLLAETFSYSPRFGRPWDWYLQRTLVLLWPTVNIVGLALRRIRVVRYMAVAFNGLPIAIGLYIIGMILLSGVGHAGMATMFIVPYFAVVVLTLIALRA